MLYWDAMSGSTPGSIEEEVWSGRPSFTSVDEGRHTQATTRQVLVVDADPAQREGVADVLVAWAYEARLSGSFEEALRAVRHKSLDAAMVDIVLPGKSGTGLLSRLREQFPEAELVAMSGLVDPAMAK